MNLKMNLKMISAEHSGRINIERLDKVCFVEEICLRIIMYNPTSVTHINMNELFRIIL